MVNTIVKARIVKIGNSQGIRIPKVWLDQAGLGADVLVTVKPNQLVIQSAHRPRQDWDEQFRMMAERGDDRLFEEAVLTRWDEDEWEW